MAHSMSAFDWDTMLDETGWDRDESLEQLLQASGAEAGDRLASPASSGRPPTWNEGLLLLFSMALLGSVLLYAWARTGVDAIHAEVQDAARAEHWLLYRGRDAQAAGLMDPQTDVAWRDAYVLEVHEADPQSASASPLPELSVDDMRLRSGLAMVQVTVTGKGAEAYRETRFFREGPDGWRRTAPNAAFWGREDVQQTRYFRIRYRRADAQSVTAVAPQLDGIYEQLRADLALTGDAPLLAVDVASVNLDSLARLHFRDKTLVVPSPLLLRAPAGMSHEDLLLASIVNPLIAQTWREAAVARASDPWQEGSRVWWDSLARGAQLWQASAHSEPAAQIARDSVRWLSSESDAEPVPGHITGLWRLSMPVYGSLEQLALTEDWQERLRATPEYPHTLRQLLAADDWDAHPLPASSSFLGWQRCVATATLVEYFVQTYGREQLSALVDGFRTHDRWETLIPDATGVTAAEFEAGWQRYVTEEYRGCSHGEGDRTD